MRLQLLEQTLDKVAPNWRALIAARTAQPQQQAAPAAAAANPKIGLTSNAAPSAAPATVMPLLGRALQAGPASDVCASEADSQEALGLSGLLAPLSAPGIGISCVAGAGVEQGQGQGKGRQSSTLAAALAAHAAAAAAGAAGAGAAAAAGAPGAPQLSRTASGCCSAPSSMCDVALPCLLGPLVCVGSDVEPLSISGTPSSQAAAMGLFEPSAAVSKSASTVGEESEDEGGTLGCLLSKPCLAADSKAPCLSSAAGAAARPVLCPLPFEARRS